PGLVQVLPSTKDGSISADLKTWTFHLRPHLVWSDGVALDARDVDYTWRLWTNPNFGAANLYGLNLIQSASVSPDNLSITFQLKQAFAPFLSVWTDGLAAPLPAHHFSALTPQQILHSGENLNPIVSSGPFTMSESLPGDHYTVIRNPRYYRAAEGLPYLEKIIFRVAPDAQTALQDIQQGNVDSSWVTDLSNLSLYQKLHTYILVANKKTTNFEAMYFNFHNAILGKNPEVRQAISMAIEYTTLIQRARFGQAVASCTDHSPALQVTVSPTCPKFDRAAANALLDQNGWYTGNDGYRVKQGQKLEFHYATTTDNAWGLADEPIIQQDLQAVGIKLDIKNYPPLTFYNSVLNDGKSGTYDIAEFGNALTYDPDDAFLFSCKQFPPSGFNVSFYCNKDLEALYTQEQATIDPKSRQAIFEQIQHIYLTDFPFITLYRPYDLGLVKKGTRNYLPSPQGALETGNVWAWWCDRGKCPSQK
ncbi:MAG: peptide ABC transporter substrate-binding protein, partial [Chloroflexota bacterium]|nr:peptide ABC transporter substrate-binding protein [Chloroflexota bacterium]